MVLIRTLQQIQNQVHAREWQSQHQVVVLVTLLSDVLEAELAFCMTRQLMSLARTPVGLAIGSHEEKYWNQNQNRNRKTAGEAQLLLHKPLMSRVTSIAEWRMLQLLVMD